MRKTHHVKLAELGNLAANNLRIIDPDRAAKFRRQAQQVVRGQVSIGGVKRVWHKNSGAVRVLIAVFSDYATVTDE